MFYKNGVWNYMDKTYLTEQLPINKYHIWKFVITYSNILRPTLNIVGSKIYFGLSKKDSHVLLEISNLIKSIQSLYIHVDESQLEKSCLDSLITKSYQVYLPRVFNTIIDDSKIIRYSIINSHLDEIFYMLDTLPKDITKIYIMNINFNEYYNEQTWRSLWRKLGKFTKLRKLKILKKTNNKTITIPDNNLLLGIRKFNTNIRFNAEYFLQNSTTYNLSCCLYMYVDKKYIEANKYLTKCKGLRLTKDNRCIFDTRSCPEIQAILNRNSHRK